MSLDLNACLKAFSVAFGQYSGHPNEQTLKYVEKQIDVSCPVKRCCCIKCLNTLVVVKREICSYICRCDGNDGNTRKYVLIYVQTDNSKKYCLQVVKMLLILLH